MVSFQDRCVGITLILLKQGTSDQGNAGTFLCSTDMMPVTEVQNFLSSKAINGLLRAL